MTDREPRFFFPILSDETTWERLPRALRGTGQALPSWARLLAGELPLSTAALLQLDTAHRVHSPVPARLRAAMRWVSAHANQCSYAEAQAAADASRASVSLEQLAGLSETGFPGWSVQEGWALAFALKMTVDSDAVTDAEFAHLVDHFGEHQAASMVLLMAYANFQDRLLICLGIGPESCPPLAPLDVEFDSQAFQVKTALPVEPPRSSFPPSPLSRSESPSLVDGLPEWSDVSYEMLQDRLELQRKKPTRLRIPDWDEVARNLPDGLINRPSDIIWYRIVFGYAPELAVPYEVFMRVAGAETSSRWERVFGSSMFWVTTRAMKCSYCMGHCEMNWEVTGLTPVEIADRSRKLAEGDWSCFAPEEQRAFGFARKLSQTPGDIGQRDIVQLQQDFGIDRALVLVFNVSRHHYMTRISNGFQLTLEQENVFYDYYNVTPPNKMISSSGSAAVELPDDQECWALLPTTIAGGGQLLPNWVKALVKWLPRTAAAMLQLDAAHRIHSPLEPVLRGKLRWVIAQANRCFYSEAYALADLQRAGASAAELDLLQGPTGNWPPEDQEPLEFVRLLTIAAPTIPDEFFEGLRVRYGDQRVAAMVLLAAYGNFQDRVILGLNLPLEDQGPLPPLTVEFAEGAFQVAPMAPAQNATVTLQPAAGQTVVQHDREWEAIPYEALQSRLEQQRNRQPRLPIPSWDDVKEKLPPAMATRPTAILWNLICFGYVPELSVPWNITTRTMWAETRPDRVFEESLFWIQTRAVQCNYCMGHCEMLLEAAGLDEKEVAERTSRLASSDWSQFGPAEQRAYAYARKLSCTPWELTSLDYQTLVDDLGPQEAMATFWWLCRGLYMTRVSDGFQLPLERENVFQPPPTAVFPVK